jgi:multidrug transporter EmrE-like cation transporter
MWSYLSLLAAVLFASIGQLLLRTGAGTEGFLTQLLHPMTIIGVLLYGVSTPFYLFAIRGIPLSIAFPSVSLSYVVVAGLSHWIWGEPLGALQIVGLALIMGGVAMLNQV